ncbi:apolipoprotein N-acyltransferase [Mycetohabitans rhizoxinica]|uniref:Apolipoprotein N-acyltransferase n=2 Tax=Mycetohabitans rhizoxinica TaxID=412963 RepID=A0ABZ2PU95_9BURK
MSPGQHPRTSFLYRQMVDKPIADPAPRPASSDFPLQHASRSRRATVLHLTLAGTIGALNTLAFAPTPHGGWLELAIFACAFWLVSRTRTLRGALLTGGAFGFGQFVSGVWWLYVSMHFYGDMPALMAGAAVVLLSLYLALYPAFSAGLWHLCRAPRGQCATFTPSWRASVTFACAWALGEWLRGTVLTGFPWLASGYAQVDGPLAGFAPLVGVYGVGWVLALVGALIIQAAMRMSGACVATWLAPAAVAAGLLACGMLLARVTWTQPSGPALSVRLLQGNVEQSMKFDPVGMHHAIALYQQLITEKPADLVVTPETAIPLPLYEAPPEFGTAVRRFVDATHTSVLFGAVGATMTENGPKDLTNALYGITPGSPVLYRYDKHHLVPFGEFIPWGFRWFVDMMKMPLGDFSRGGSIQPPFIVHGQPIAPNICYEDIFGEALARTLRGQSEPASVLVNSTNLGWFGNTIALDQHLQMARMRALETGRPMLRATNTGATALIDAHGSVKAQLRRFTVGALDVRVQGRSGMTPYLIAGNITILVISLVGLAIGLGMGRRSSAGRACE